MTSSLSEFLEEYDDLSNEMMSASRNDFLVRLKHLYSFIESDDDNLAAHILYLKNRLAWEGIEAHYLQTSSGIGGGYVKLPEDEVDIVSLYLNIFQRMLDGNLTLEKFSLAYFRDGSNNLELIHLNFITKMLRPFVSGLRRYIRKHYDDSPPTIDNVSPIPASNRVVTLQHNSQHAEIVKSIELLEEQLRGDNSIPSDDREQIKKELEAGRIIFSGTKARLLALGAVLLAPLYWVLEKMAGSVVGELAKKALGLIETYLPTLLEAIKKLL